MPLSPERTLEVLSVAREALRNIARHAKATRSEILVATAEESNGLTLTSSTTARGSTPTRPAAWATWGWRTWMPG